MKVVGYVRLSRDEDKESYSSILSQKSIIEEYARLHNWSIARYYEDDNCSGYTFDRPAFNRLMADLEAGEADVVIAKDLSRIGRHNAYTLLFLDRMKKLNKRLILPGEGRGYDTLGDESDLLGITTWYNEMYVKDISRKIKGSIRARQKEGRLIIREAFGYRRCAEDKHMLEVDPEAACIVQEIFRLYLSGLGYRKIAETLNAQGAPTPSQYHVQKYGLCACSSKTASAWNSVHVQRILKNDIYIGTLRQAKTEKKTIRGKSQKNEMDQHYVFEAHHPAIIGRGEFEEARKIADSRRGNHDKGAASQNNIFSGLLFCRDCGSYMIAYNKEGKARSYICGNYHRNGKQACKRHTIKEERLEAAVMALLKEAVTSLRGELQKIIISDEDADQDQKPLLLHKLKQEQLQAKEQLKLVIMRNIIESKKESQDKYQNITTQSLAELETELKKRLLYLERTIQQLKRQQLAAASPKQRDSLQLMEEIINRSKLQRRDVQRLIDKIHVDGRQNVMIYMKMDLEPICNHIREDVNLVPDL